MSSNSISFSSSSSSSSFFFFFFFFFFFSSSISSAFNITKILSKHSDFSTFNDLLTQSKLADQINNRETTTVLAVDNSGVSSLSGKPSNEIKRTLSRHVILDYYDPEKLKRLKNNKSTTLTTLFQASGKADKDQGFLTVTTSDGDISFKSAAPGSTSTSRLMKSVASQPYNISVLQVSSIISAPGFADSPAGSPDSSPLSPAPAPAPRKKKARPPSDDEEGSPPAPEDEAEGPAAEVPAPAEAPKAESSGAPAANIIGVIKQLLIGVLVMILRAF